MKYLSRPLVVAVLLTFVVVPQNAFAGLECVQDGAGSVLINSKTGNELNATKLVKSSKRKVKRAKKTLAKLKKKGASKKKLQGAKRKLKTAKVNLAAANACKSGGGTTDGPKGEGRVQIGDGSIYIVYRYIIHDADVTGNKACSVVGFLEFSEVPGVTYSTFEYTSLNLSPVGPRTIKLGPPYNDNYEFAHLFREHTFRAPAGKHQVLIYENTFRKAPNAKLGDCVDSVESVQGFFESPALS